MGSYKQVPSNPDNWLHNNANDYTRYFAKFAYPAGNYRFPECTTAEKEAWEAEHPQPEPPEPENE